MTTSDKTFTRATFPGHSLLQPGEIAYLSSRIILSNGQLSTELLAIEEDGRSKSRLEQFGKPIQRGHRRSRPLSWDLGDKAAVGGERFSVQNLSISLRQVEPFDLEASSAPEALKLLARKARTLKWFCVWVLGQQLVFSSLMLVERLLSTNAQMAAVLLSPFREMVFRMHKDSEDTTVLLDAAELGMGAVTGGSHKNGDRAMLADLLCFGYWAHLREGFAFLDEVTAAIRGERALPTLSVDDQFPIKAPAVKAGNTFYAQALSTDIGHMRWPANWTSLTFLGGTGRAGLVLHPKPDRSTLPLRERHVVKHNLDRLECSRRMHELGWRKTRPSNGVAAAKLG